MNPINSEPVYRPEIDGLRALAIFFHAGFQLFEGGFVGVDVFFVISGYLITSIILRERVALFHSPVFTREEHGDSCRHYSWFFFVVFRLHSSS